MNKQTGKSVAAFRLFTLLLALLLTIVDIYHIHVCNHYPSYYLRGDISYANASHLQEQ